MTGEEEPAPASLVLPRTPPDLSPMDSYLMDLYLMEIGNKY